MSDLNSTEILLIGLPGSGKTSFLAALWYMVGQSTRDCILKLDRLDQDSKYLNEIRDAWLRYEPVPRNRFDTAKMVSMLLKGSDGRKVRLSFPDMSGESFRMQWSKRQLTTQYDELLRQASGAMIFIGPSDLRKPHRIDAVVALAEAITNVVESQREIGMAEQRAEAIAWDIERAPTQVQLVEMLQIVANRDYFNPRFRLAVVISAWDEVASLSMSPAQYLTSELPLLDQFFKSNPQSFEREVFGLSAQGAKYGQDSDLDPKLEERPPSERITVVGAQVTDVHDITGPIQWLMQ